MIRARIRLPTLLRRRSTAALAAAALFGAACGDDGTTPPVVSISVSPTTLSLEVGETAPLTATVTGANGASVNWTSSNVAVASVDQSGTVTGEAAGPVTITASVAGQTGVNATVAVTVTEPPLSVELLGFEKDGQAVAADALSGLVDAKVRFEAPVGTTGRIEIVAGTTVLGSVDVGGAAVVEAPSEGPARSAEGGGAPAISRSGAVEHGQRPFAAGARIEEVVDVPISVSVFDEESLTAAVPNDSDTQLLSRFIPTLGSPVNGSTVTIRGVNSSVLVLDGMRGTDRSLTLGGTNWYNGDFTARARLMDYGSAPGLVDIEQIEVLRGPQATLFGRNATNGVAQILLPRNEPFANGGVGDVEGPLRFGATADIRRADGTRETVQIANNLTENGVSVFPDLQTETYLDNVAPLVEPSLSFQAPIWLQADLQAQFSLDPGLRWAADENGPATVFDGGVGGVTGTFSGGVTTDYELGQYFDGTALGERFPDLYVKADFTDALDNTAPYPFLDEQGTPVLAGRDVTPPAAPVFRVGAQYTLNETFNVADVNFAWDIEDLPGAGGVISGPGGTRVAVGWERDGESGCLLGAPIDGGCSEVALDPGANDGWGLDLTGRGSFEINLDFRVTDRGLNFGPYYRIQLGEDRVLPTLTGDASLPTDLSGTVDVTFPVLEDDLELRLAQMYKEFFAPGLLPLSLLAEGVDIGVPFDGVWQTTAQPTLSVSWYRGIETTESGFPARPTGTFYAPGSIAITVQDHGGNFAFNRTTVTGNVAPTTSFLAGGMDHAGWQAGTREICSSFTAQANACGAVPTSLEVGFEAFTSGQFEITQAQLWGVLPGPPGQVSAARVSEIIDLAIADLGTFREARAGFTLDAVQLHLNPGSTFDAFWLGRAPDGRTVMTSIESFLVR